MPKLSLVSIANLWSRKRLLLLTLAIMVIGMGGVVLSQTAFVNFFFEAEGASGQGLITRSDVNASGGQYVEFGTVATAQPTRNNTGPRFPMTDITPSQFYSTRTCNRQRIVGSVDFDKPSMFAQTFTLTDCEITGSFGVYLRGGGAPLTLSEMPIINMDYVDIDGGMFPLNATKLTMNHTYVANHSQWTVTDVFANGLTADAPYVVMNSVFYATYASQPTHTEALHVSSGKGMQFINVSFEQQGGALANSGVTATINYHGVNALFDGCWFIFDGPIPAYYTAYLDAGNSVVKNSHFEGTAGSYVYPSSSMKPTFQNNYDFNTGQPISL